MIRLEPDQSMTVTRLFDFIDAVPEDYADDIKKSFYQKDTCNETNLPNVKTFFLRGKHLDEGQERASRLIFTMRFRWVVKTGLVLQYKHEYMDDTAFYFCGFKDEFYRVGQYIYQGDINRMNQ